MFSIMKLNKLLLSYYNAVFTTDQNQQQNCLLKNLTTLIKRFSCLALLLALTLITKPKYFLLLMGILLIGNSLIIGSTALKCFETVNVSLKFNLLNQKSVTLKLIIIGN